MRPVARQGRIASCPPRRSPTWGVARRYLSTRLSTAACPKHVRAWQQIWYALHSGPPPVQITWASLCGDFSFLDFLNFLMNGSEIGPLRFALWNIQRLVNAKSRVISDKRKIVSNLVLKQQILVLKQTHWTIANCITWAYAFPTATVICTPARATRQHDRQGCVAIIVPPAFNIIHHDLILFGCMIEARLVRKSDGRGGLRHRHLPTTRRQT